MGAPLSAEEKARRSVALTVAEQARPRVDDIVRDVEEAIAAMPAAEPIAERIAAPCRRLQDHPAVTITITGAPSSGKSVVAHLIRNALAYEGIATSGPDELRSIAWRRAVQDLIARGIRVVLEARETGDA